MKLMKKMTIALVVCAIPAMAFAQTVSCEGCDHRVSVYRGSGGLIATADGDAEMVNYRATCNNVTRTGQLTPGADGVVSLLLTGDLACMEANDDNAFDLGPVTDGGWFWLHVGENSAVGNIVAKDILENETVTITDAGASVTTTTGAGAVLLTHTASGRVGILPNILPEPPATSTPARKCGYTGDGTAASPYKVLNTDCALGDGGTQLIGTTTDPITGRISVVRDGATVTRPAGSANVDIVVDLLGNGSGHFRTDANATGNGLLRGHPDFVMTDATSNKRAAARIPVDPQTTLKVGRGPTAEEIPPDVGGHASGIGWNAGSNVTDAIFIRIRAASAYCSKTANHPAQVVIAAVTTSLARRSVTPTLRLEAADSSVIARMSFTVACPSAAANQGRDLAPENPFPVERRSNR